MNVAAPISPMAMAPGRTYQEVLDQDTRQPIPAPLRFRNTVDLGVAPIRADRYASRAFFELEAEKVFLKTWQYAVREEEIPNPGDTYVFDLIDKSLLITRQQDGSIKALHNVCRHRGRKLATQGGCKEQFRCAYHGMAWNIDGSFRNNPFAWDYPQIDEATFSLPSVQVESWAGFVFVNFDPDAPPLESLMGPMPEHFEHWRIQDCYKAAHVSKIVPANWKVVAEAFMEAHHVFGTHPQAVPFVPCEQAQYDMISDHVTRFIAPAGIVGELWDGPVLSEGRMIQTMMGAGSRANMPGEKVPDIDLKDGETARSYMADVARRALQAETGYDFSGACDSDMLDGFSYELFPNFHVWGAFPQKICYRFRPNGTNHEETIWEVMMMRIVPKDKPRPSPAQVRELGTDEPWALVMDQLGYLATLFDQDMANMKPVQDGLRALGDGVIHFGRYSEMPCRNMHRLIDDYIGR